MAIQGIKSPRPGIVAIDLHRGHLDMAIATMPLAADASARVVAANERFFSKARAAGIPVFHCVATYRDADEIRLNPAWRHRGEDPNNPRKNVLAHNIKGMPGCEVMPTLLDQSDFIIDAKKRYDCFTATDLDLSLRAHGVDTVLITGVNTNSCVIATATAACCRDFAVVVVSDCVDTMDGPELHNSALSIIGRAFGQVMTADEALTAVAGAGAAPIQKRA
ncbi:MAG: cysteine hydrolase [Pseudorhodoplanes sp.]